MRIDTTGSKECARLLQVHLSIPENRGARSAQERDCWQTCRGRGGQANESRASLENNQHNWLLNLDAGSRLLANVIPQRHNTTEGLSEQLTDHLSAGIAAAPGCRIRYQHETGTCMVNEQTNVTDV